MTTIEKNAAVSRMILARVEAGATLAAALDAVLGAGSYRAIASDLYDTMRAAPAVADDPDAIVLEACPASDRFLSIND
jgi:hypothetical protein